MDGALIGVNPHNGDLQWQRPVQGRLLDRGRDAGVGSGQSAVRVVRVRRRRQGRRAAPERHADHGHTNCGARSGCGCITATRSASATPLYFSSGGKGSQAILSAVDVRSGKIHWQERSIEKATFVWADQQADHPRSGRHADDRLPVAARLQDRREGAAADRAVLDAAGARRHPPLHPRSTEPDGGRPRLTIPGRRDAALSSALVNNPARACVTRCEIIRALELRLRPSTHPMTLTGLCASRTCEGVRRARGALLLDSGPLRPSARARPRPSKSGSPPGRRTTPRPGFRPQLLVDRGPAPVLVRRNAAAAKACGSGSCRRANIELISGGVERQVEVASGDELTIDVGPPAASDSPRPAGHARDRTAYGTRFNATALELLPQSNGVYGLLERSDPLVITERMEGGGTYPEPQRLGASGASWTQTSFKLGDADITDPDRTGFAMLYPNLDALQAVGAATAGSIPIPYGAGTAVTLVPRMPSAKWHAHRAVRSLAAGVPIGESAAGRRRRSPGCAARAAARSSRAGRSRRGSAF